MKTPFVLFALAPIDDDDFDYVAVGVVAGEKLAENLNTIIRGKWVGLPIDADVPRIAVPLNQIEGSKREQTLAELRELGIELVAGGEDA